MVQFGDFRLPARIWAKIQVPEDTDECWLWTAALTSGYGYVRYEGRNHNAHRAVYLALVDRNIEGLDVDHLCHGLDKECPGGTTCLHRRCVNPAHLEAVTPAENKLRGRSPLAVHAAKTHCKNGHPLSGENLWMDHGGRICRICKTAKNAEWRSSNRDKWLESNRRHQENKSPEQRERDRQSTARYKARKKAAS